MDDQSERSRRRDQRERETIAALAALAQSPSLERIVAGLRMSGTAPAPTNGTAKVAIEVDEPIGVAPNV